MTLVLDWLKKLGYKHDPFADKPTAHIIGLKELRSNINLFLLKEQKLGFLKFGSGMGKSSFIMWLEKELKTNRKLLVLEESITSREKLELFLDKETAPTFKSFLKGSRTKEEQLTDIAQRFMKKPYLLVVESVRSLTSAQVAFLDELLQTQLQILLLGDTKDKNPLTTKPSLEMEIDSYSPEELVLMLQTRIEEAGSTKTFPFNEKELARLIKQSGGNPRKLFLLARDRAMELSLEDIAPQAPQRIEAVKEKPQPTEKKKGFSLFGKIRFEVKEESEEEPKKPVLQSKETKSEVSDDAMVDADMLREIVSSMEKQK